MINTSNIDVDTYSTLPIHSTKPELVTGNQKAIPNLGFSKLNSSAADDDSLVAMLMKRKRSHHDSFNKVSDEEVGKSQRVSFEATECCTALPEPPIKRRRFQRRNSQTAKTLFASISSFTDIDFGKKELRRDQDDHDVDRVEIAQDLIRQLNFRRKSTSS